MKWPDDSIMNIIQSKYAKLVKKFRQDDQILPVPFRRYFDDLGNVKNPNWNQQEQLHHLYYAGYLLINKNYISNIKEYLNDPSTPVWMLYQFEEAKKYSAYAYQRRIQKLEQNIINTEEDLIEINQTIGNVSTLLTQEQIKFIDESYS